MSLYKEVLESYGRIKPYIDGVFRESESREYIKIFNPAKNEVIAELPISTGDEVDEAVDSAYEAYLKWRETPIPTRIQILFRMKSVLEKYRDEIARVIVQNHGKIYDEALGEVRRAIENVETAIGVAYLLQKGEYLENVAGGIDEYLVREPLGVAAIISPFNFPVMVPFWFIPYALAVGDTVVVKPSELTPVPFYWVMKLLHEEAKIPPGLINVVYGLGDVGDRLVSHKKVFGVAFVGSTKVARYIYKRVGELGKRAILQAGAKNYAVVMPDAKIDKTVTNLISSFFGNTGQRCLANSILVPIGDAYNKVVPKFIELAKNLRLGYGLDSDVDIGPVVSMKALEKIRRYIDIGVEEGARLSLDGRNVKVDKYPDGYFIGPTIFEDVTPDMTIAREEIFGPVASIIEAESLDQVIEMMDKSEYGNAASIFTSSGAVARKFRRGVNIGNIGINIGIAAPMAFFPFGGRKESFFGVVHGQVDSLDFFTDKKIVIERWW
ncbi:MAG TPA: CoA-acylating methylmalonate-semialdehyde dehydrogenase [Thermoprotei archaeon]|nr:CoA-acylating methylmalonate-semialdehyde dehydrogenase [Thermoprotei archaeon]